MAYFNDYRQVTCSKDYKYMSMPSAIKSSLTQYTDIGLEF